MNEHFSFSLSEKMIEFSIYVKIIWKNNKYFVTRPLALSPFLVDEKTLIILFCSCELVKACFCLQRNYVEK